MYPNAQGSYIVVCGIKKEKKKKRPLPYILNTETANHTLGRGVKDPVEGRNVR